MALDSIWMFILNQIKGHVHPQKFQLFQCSQVRWSPPGMDAAAGKWSGIPSNISRVGMVRISMAAHYPNRYGSGILFGI